MHSYQERGISSTLKRFIRENFSESAIDDVQGGRPRNQNSRMNDSWELLPVSDFHS